MKNSFNLLIILLVSITVFSCSEKSKSVEKLAEKAENEVKSTEKSKPKAFSLNLTDLTTKIYEGSEFKPLEILGNDVRGGDVFESEDGEFLMGGMELIMDENTIAQYDYVSFTRSELMYFTSGGMQLIEKDGSMVEAKTGEFIFIPKGWKGTRIFTGDKLVQKFSVVYYQKGNEELVENQPALSFTEEGLTHNLYEGKDFKFIEQLKSKGRGAKPFVSGDKQFALGGLHFLMEADFEREHRYDNFPRNELMFFSKGGMKLIDDEGTVVEAKKGEFIFIPKGWSGKRFFTGDDEGKKFSAVYYNSQSN